MEIRYGFAARLVNHSVSGEYRGAGKPSRNGIYKTSAETNLIRRRYGKRGRTIQNSEKNIPESMDKPHRFQKKRKQTNGRRNYAEALHARISAEDWANLVGGYEQMMSGRVETVSSHFLNEGANSLREIMSSFSGKTEKL